MLLREALGRALREQRHAQGRTLHEVATAARISLGYLSDLERGRKEASSELLTAICRGLNLPLSHLLTIASHHAASPGHTPSPRHIPSPAHIPSSGPGQRW